MTLEHRRAVARLLDHLHFIECCNNWDGFGEVLAELNEVWYEATKDEDECTG